MLSGANCAGFSGENVGMKDQVFKRADDSSDEAFYAAPRFVTHIDAGAIAAVTQLYREYLPADGAILDLMTSWVSHLPPEVRYSSVTGLGMNAAELAANPRLTTRIVQNLNSNPVLPFDTASIDGACICVSVDYLTQPVRVLREVGRVLRGNAPLLITFSNRCFPTKVIAPWLELNDAGRVALVKNFLELAGNFTALTALDRSPQRGDPLYALIGHATLDRSTSSS